MVRLLWLVVFFCAGCVNQGGSTLGMISSGGKIDAKGFAGVVTASVSSLAIDLSATQSANSVDLTNQGGAVTITKATITPPFQFDSGCGVGTELASAGACHAVFTVKSDTPPGNYSGTASFEFSDGKTLSLPLSATVSATLGQVVNADNNNVNQLVTCNTPTRLGFSSKSRDPKNVFDTALSRFTPGAGRWLINAATEFAANAGSPLNPAGFVTFPGENSSLQLQLYRNGTLYRSGPLGRNYLYGPGAALTYVVDSAAGDYFEIYATYSNGCSAAPQIAVTGWPAAHWLQVAATAAEPPSVSADDGGAGQSIACNTSTKLRFSHKGADPAGLFDATASRITPGAGRWLINTSTSAPFPYADSALQVSLYRNGQLYKSGAMGRAYEYGPGAGLTFVVDAAAGDYFEIYATYLKCTASVALSDVASDTWLQVAGLPSQGTAIQADRNGASQTVACNNVTKLSFSNKSNDPANAFDVAQSRLTPGEGYWAINAAALFSQTGGLPAINSQLQLSLYKNGALLKQGAIARTHQYAQGASVFAVVSAEAGDYFEVYATYSNCSVGFPLSGSPSDTWLEVAPWQVPTGI